MSRRRPVALLFTCEHGGNEIPPAYTSLFNGAAEVLQSHRGWDPGALELAEGMADKLAATLFLSETSRLLIELNRSLDHDALFSEYTRGLSSEEKQRLVAAYYRPYRDAVEREIASATGDGQAVLHVSVHSFTPQLNGEVRDADIGLLYDPSRDWEAGFCDAWRRELSVVAPHLRVRMNYPYLGTDDGFTTYLRTRFTNAQYAGVEIEVNQQFPLGQENTWKALQSTLIQSLDAARNTDR